MTKPGFDLKRHMIIGTELAIIRDQLSRLGGEIGNAYTKALGDRLLRAVREIDKVRIDLEVKASREFPEEFETTIYFPHPEMRE